MVEQQSKNKTAVLPSLDSDEDLQHHTCCHHPCRVLGLPAKSTRVVLASHEVDFKHATSVAGLQTEANGRSPGLTTVVSSHVDVDYSQQSVSEYLRLEGFDDNTYFIVALLAGITRHCVCSGLVKLTTWTPWIHAV
jgi:hypothetical protein